jgi:hypothetical protein
MFDRALSLGRRAWIGRSVAVAYACGVAVCGVLGAAHECREPPRELGWTPEETWDDVANKAFRGGLKGAFLGALVLPATVVLLPVALPGAVLGFLQRDVPRLYPGRPREPLPP